MKIPTPSIFHLFTLLLSLTLTTAATTTTTTTPTTTTFLQTKCRSATYPTLCLTSLTPYSTTINTSPRRLAETALNISLDRARHAKTHITRIADDASSSSSSSSAGRQRVRLKHRDMVALKDCKEEMSDTVDRLEKSLRELKRAGEVEAANEEEFSWRMSNVETWVSAGLTDDGTCADGFSGGGGGGGSGGGVKSKVRKQMVEVEMLTSNALAFINQYANKQ